MFRTKNIFHYFYCWGVHIHSIINCFRADIVLFTNVERCSRVNNLMGKFFFLYDLSYHFCGLPNSGQAISSAIALKSYLPVRLPLDCIFPEI